MRHHPEGLICIHGLIRTIAAYSLTFSLAVLFAALLALPAQQAIAQDLDLSVQTPTGDNNPATYALDSGEVSFIDGTVRFLATGTEINNVQAWGVSPGLSVVAMAQDGGTTNRNAGAGTGATAGGTRALIMNTTGDTLASYSLGSTPAGDESLALFPGDNGSLWVRSNISTFTGYDIFGRSSLSLSGGSQGSGGATMPHVAADPSGRTLMLYTTQIKTESGSLGSGAQRLAVNGQQSGGGRQQQGGQQQGGQQQGNITQPEFESIFYSQDRTIIYADVSDDGQFMVLVTRAQGTDDRVHILDRYGNTIAAVTTDEELAGANLSGSAEYLVAWSPGRAIVYSTLTGERVRSASFGDPLYHAQYFPEDKTIVGLTGNFSERAGMLGNAGFYAIDLGAGSISSAEMGTSLGFSGDFRPQFRRTGAGQYLLLGGSRQVSVRTSF
ncbi:MAG: hypothetical protein U5K31_03005 [Balneolaceae bacterium]|nr:hypothetical protein [Balneolaceae bacterium]